MQQKEQDFKEIQTRQISQINKNFEKYY